MKIKEQDISDFQLNDEFINQSKINYYRVFSLMTFHVFLIEIDKEETLEKIWKKLNSKIAFYMQDKFESNFEKWNLYLFFIINEDCSVPIKYEIENNPFSSRKIVIENNNKKDSHEDIISTHIFDLDIELNIKEQIKLDEFKQGSKIFNLIKEPEIELSRDGRSKDESITVIYEKLLKIYSDEV
ncbi:ABC-three component system middle component 1 [Psychroserpens luteus]|uniref:ABC-three component system middle component 1 n=1 Tax=Psychroserpens luteus TaxID=1434066 RepID=A0ABW5ZYU2_9FLAO|nr:ABC-three component system middle component 1 [Psychroserpens luteus]